MLLFIHVILLTAYDGTDDKATEKRLANRDAHIKFSNELIAKKQMLFGVALLNGEGKMIGSSIVYDFPSKEELEKTLNKNEPYILGNVWQKIDIESCKIGPSFESLFIN